MGGGPHYKVPIIDSYKVPRTCVGPCYKVPIIDSCEKITSYMWEDPVTRFPSLTVTRFPVHVGGPCYTVPIIDSYKIPTFISYCTCGGTPLQSSHH